MNPSLQQHLIDLTQQLLESIAHGAWTTYEQLCDTSLTAFEPEARGQLVEGLAFHKFFFDLGRRETARNTTMCSPHVRLLGTDGAVVSYVRLHQSLNDQGVPETKKFEETRVWQRHNGQWKHVHFHRSVTN